jgi:hypothetical protein
LDEESSLSHLTMPVNIFLLPFAGPAACEKIRGAKLFVHTYTIGRVELVVIIFSSEVDKLELQRQSCPCFAQIEKNENVE